MYIKSQRAVKLFYFGVNGICYLFGFQIWINDSHRKSYRLSVFALFWSFVVFAVVVYCKFFYDTEKELSISYVYATQISALADILYNNSEKIKIFAVFLPIWIFGYKKRQILNFLIKIEDIFKLIDLNRGFLTWQIVIFVVILHAAYFYYIARCIVVLVVDFELINFESWGNVALFVKYMGSIVFSTWCIIDLTVLLCYIVTRFEQINQKLKELDMERYSFLV